MPSTEETFENIITTNKNTDSKNSVIEAMIIGNYSDPGISEDYHFDLLSRFLVCKIESSNRMLSADKYQEMVVIVKRPENLWISYVGGFLDNPSQQQRADYNQNTNLGVAGNYTTNVIPEIDIPYNLGDKINIGLIKDNSPISLFDGNSFFQSECTRWDSTTMNYQGSFSQGISDPYIASTFGVAGLQQKTIMPFNSSNPSLGQYNNSNYFYCGVNKAQYEAAILQSYASDSVSLVSLFTQQSNFSSFYTQNGGYYFTNNIFAPLNYVKYEDLTVRNRTTTSSCIPLIVTTPSTFSVPTVRTTSTISYFPTYNITKSS